MKDTPDHSDSTQTDIAAPEGRELSERFVNPGLPAHRFRGSDTDPAAAARAERQVSTIFALSAVGSLIAGIGYFVFPLEGTLGSIQRSTVVLGLGLGLAILAIGVGLVHWARTLMPDHDQIEMRHDIRGTEEDRAAAISILEDGFEESGIGRRKLIRNSLLGSFALLPFPVLFLFRDLGPLPHKTLEETLWKKGRRLTRDPDGTPIKADEVTFGSVFHVIPDGLNKSAHPLEEKAKAAVLLVRIQPELVKADPARKGWDVDGIYAYSKICTHVGCPVALYEQQTHHLLCPCHQSTFDLAQHCKVIFGPAKRPLPQLPITVDSEGYLVAKGGLSDPPGPSYWERS
jgi:ubiquinol-cytochrome c reductase iron-sulfur subunit